MKKYILSKALILLFFIILTVYIVLMFRFQSEREIILNVTAIIFIIIMFSSIPICIFDYQLTKKTKKIEYKSKLEEKESIEEKKIIEKQIQLEKEMENVKLKFEEQKKKVFKENTIKKLQELLFESDRINLNTMRTTLQLEKKFFDAIIFEWAEKYNFRIDGDFLLINDKKKISSFLNYLSGEVKQKQQVYCKHCGKWIGPDISICPHCLKDQ